MQTGEEHAWEILSGLNPEHVCHRVKATFDKPSGLYSLKLFGHNIAISLNDNAIFSSEPESKFILQKCNYPYISILRYLIDAKDIRLSGKLVKPSSMTGGQIYIKGSHVLPLDKIAEKYGSDSEEFIRRGRKVGGVQLTYGDVSLGLFPFPKIPVTLILWKNDDEFSARANLLFDSTCEFHLPADIIWSIAMMSVHILL